MRALSEELENPMNVHRWRKLEGSDPATYELVQKLQVTSYEERLAEPRLGGLLAHDHRAELAVIADEDELLGACK